MAGMKRGAPIQLTRDHSEEDDDMEVMTTGEFKKADQSILASRPMKGLPKRGNAVAATYDAPEPKKLDFGAATQSFATPNSSFTFSTPSPTPTSTLAKPASTSSAFKFSSTAVSPSATSATKQLASILVSAPQPNGINISASTEKSSVSLKDDPAVKYFASLRGLNESFRQQIKELLDEDPIVDLTDFLDMYSEYRASIEKEFEESQGANSEEELDESQESQASLPNGMSSTSSVTTKPTSSDVQMPTALSMPTPPKAFAGFGMSSSTAGPSTSGSSAPVGGGFKPNFSAISSSSTVPSTFSFGSSSANVDKPTSTPSPFGASGSSGSSSSPFGASSAALKPSPFGGGSSSSFPFGSTSTKATDKPSSPFGSGGVFGGASSSGESDRPSGSNIFGSSSTSSSTTAPAFDTSGSSSSSNAFGLGASKPPSGGFANTGGFSFNGKSSTSATEEPKESTADTDAENEPVASSSKTTSPFGSTSSVPSKFSFGSNADAASTSAKPSAPASVTSGIESRSGTPLSGEGSEARAEDKATPNLLGDNPNDREGEGEENEDTVHTTRMKVFRFGKKEDKSPCWIDVGVGMLRIKRHKETGVLRLLSRNSGNGKIMMNFRLYPGFKFSRAKQVLNFIGHDGAGQEATFRVRIKDEASAIELHDAIKSAVATLEA